MHQVSGFTAANVVYPDDRAAVVVLTNLDATGASSQIAGRIATALFRAPGPGNDAKDAEQASQSLRGGMTGRSFRIKAGPKTLRVSTFTMPDGTLEQYQVAAAE